MEAERSDTDALRVKESGTSSTNATTLGITI